MGFRTFVVLGIALLAGLARAAEPSTLDMDQAQARWDGLKAYAAQLPESHRAGHVNAMFNTYAYRTDLQLHGVPDYWDTPLEFVARGAGDCEDFAIAKYAMLLEAGFAPEHVKLGFVHYAAGAGGPLGAVKPGPRAHIVVLVRDAGHERDPLVLDVIDEVAPLSARPDLHLVFDFDLRGTYLQHDRAVPVAAVERKMVQWLEVVRRGDLVPDAAQLQVASRGAAPVRTAMAGGGSARTTLR